MRTDGLPAKRIVTVYDILGRIMRTPELQSDVTAKIVDQFQKWSDYFNQKRDAEALAQTLHPKSLSECLPPGRMHITGPEAREIVSIFQSMEGFSQWQEDALGPLGDRDTNVLRIVVVAKRGRSGML